MCGHDNLGGIINPIFGQCQGVNSNGNNSEYFKGNDSNLPLSSWDFDTVWETVPGGYPALVSLGTADSVAGGDGTEGEPYQIETCLQLQNMNSHLDAFYILNNDIDCFATSISDMEHENYEASLYNNGDGFDPIGSVDYGEGLTYYSFEGVLDGQDYKITNLYINRTDDTYFGDGYYVGLFFHYR